MRRRTRSWTPCPTPLAGGLSGGVASIQQEKAAAARNANADNYTTIGGMHLNLGFGGPLTVQSDSELRGGKAAKPAPAPLGPGAQAAKSLKKAGGKGKSGSGYKAIRKQLEALDGVEGSDAERQYAAEIAKRDINAWREKHEGRGEGGSKRDRAMAGALDHINEYSARNAVGDDPALLEAYQGATPDLDTLVGGHRRYKGTKELNEHHRLKMAAARTSGDEQEKEQQLAYMKQARNLQGDMRDALPGMEERYLKSQVEQRGKLGGTSTGVLGSGNAGTAHRARFGDDDLIFKAQEQLPEVMLAAGTTAEVGAMRSVASSRVNDLLGTSVITKTELAEMDGMYGTAMAAAPGRGVRSAVPINSLGITSDQVPATASWASGSTIFEDQGFDYSDPKLQEGLLDLQLNDILSAQVDRHAGNYHVSQGEDGAVSGVHGFDLDASFGADMGDWHEGVNSTNFKGQEVFGNAVDLPPLLSERQAQMIEKLDLMALNATLADLLPEEEITASLQRAIELKDHVQLLRQEGKIVESFNQDSFSKLVQAGEKKSYVARDHLSGQAMKATMEAIEDLRNQGQQATPAEASAQADHLEQSGLLA
jgi:hypothetical protein